MTRILDARPRNSTRTNILRVQFTIQDEHTQTFLVSRKTFNSWDQANDYARAFMARYERLKALSDKSGGGPGRDTGELCHG